MKKLLKISGFILLALLLIQFIPVDKTQHAIDKKIQFENIEHPSEKMAVLMKNACYDCHSFETVYPDYASYAPVSWVIAGHVSDARSKVNFSKWGTYNADLKKSITENIIQVLQDKSMPKTSYVVYHPEANITTAQRSFMAKYFQKILDSGSYKLK